MSEKKSGAIDPENIYSGNIDTKTVKKSMSQDTVKVRFKANRKHDLHIGRNCIEFLPYQTLPIPKAWLNHRDWENEKKYFDIIEV